MACYHPLGVRVGKRSNESRRAVVFDRVLSSMPVGSSLPCGKCIGCKLEYSRQWAMRCMHESELHSDNCSITLTYDDFHLPSNGSVDVRDFQLFMKRLRKRAGVPVRFFHCGEYGETLGRPHYHACLFGFDFDDKIPVEKSEAGYMLYQSSFLDSVWAQGRARIGDMSFDSAAYVARYCVKKITGPDAKAHYGDKSPEYVTMSRRPGIGSGWFDKFKSDVFPGDYVVVNGVKTRPPKYYNGLYEKSNPREYSDIKDMRSVAGFKSRGELSSDRLGVREYCKEDRIKLLNRS